MGVFAYTMENLVRSKNEALQRCTKVFIAELIRAFQTLNCFQDYGELATICGKYIYRTRVYSCSGKTMTCTRTMTALVSTLVIVGLGCS